LSNPTKDRVGIRLFTNRTKEIIDIQLIDAKGQILLVNQWVVSEGTSIQEIDLSTYPAGIYRLRLKSEERQEWIDLTKI